MEGEQTVSRQVLHRSVDHRVKRRGVNKSTFKGLGDYATAVAWLDRADAIPMAMPDVREGVKVRRSLFVALNV